MAGAIDHPMAAVDEAGIWRELKAIEAGRESARQKTVIGVQKRHLVSSDCGQSSIARRRQSLIRLPDQPNVGKPIDDRIRVIGRSVINDKDLERPLRLREHTADCLSQKVRMVVCRDNNSNTWTRQVA